MSLQYFEIFELKFEKKCVTRASHYNDNPTKDIVFFVTYHDAVDLEKSHAHISKTAVVWSDPSNIRVMESISMRLWCICTIHVWAISCFCFQRWGFE